MVIAVLNSKGGVGKTTIATNLAACFAGDGKDVLLVDADPQASALEWKAGRPEDATALQVVGLPADNLHQEVKRLRKKYELLIIDGGGRITKTARAAALAADLVLVPTLPSKYDIAATQDFFTQVLAEVISLKEEVRAAILLNQVQAGTSISQAAQEQLTDLQHPLLDTLLHLYVAYKESAAMGLSVVEYDKGGKAAQEMSALFTELKGAL
jgi:chromosome partitioning protein